MMEEKWERVGEETSLQHMHLTKEQNKKEKWALRAYIFSSPMVVVYDYGSLQSPFQALTNGSLQSLQELARTARTLSRVKTLLAKKWMK
jgi:hypothetical protein